MLPELDLPAPTVLPLDRFAEGLALHRTASAQGRLHAVKALRFHGPGDVRLEDVPRPEPGPGEVLVQVEVALTDGTDLKAFRARPSRPARAAAEPVRARVLRRRRRHRSAGRRRELGSLRRMRRMSARRGDALRDLLPLLNGAYAEYVLVPGADRPREPAARPGLAARHSLRWSSRSPAACTASSRRRQGRRLRRRGRPRADRADALRLRRRCRRPADRGRRQAGAARPGARLRRRARRR